MEFQAVTVRSPAKLNLHLGVLGKRQDGYHDIESWMHILELADDLVIEPLRRPGISIGVANNTGQAGSGAELKVPPEKENIIFKAVMALCAEAGEKEQTPVCAEEFLASKPGLCVRLVKRIPVAAGMGGGSSNAAAIIAALNSIWELGFTPVELRNLGRKIGADVPFFLFGVSAWAEGIGEILTPAPVLKNIHLAIASFGFGVRAGWAYALVKTPKIALTGKAARIKIFNSVLSGDMPGLAESARNDLMPGVVAGYPVVGEVVRAMKSAGAVCAGMTGSGPAVYGLFETEQAARGAEKIIRAGIDGVNVCCTRPAGSAVEFNGFIDWETRFE